MGMVSHGQDIYAYQAVFVMCNTASWNAHNTATDDVVHTQ